MNQVARKIALLLIVALIPIGLGYALSYGHLPRADFVFINLDEPKTLDPAKATGEIEHRLLNALYEGLLRSLPDGTAKDGEFVPMSAQPGIAERYDVSEDGLVYTFKLRKNATWSNGQTITAADFAWSWQRCLHPETASQYAYQLYYIQGAEAYNTGQLKVGDRVEIELHDRKDPYQLYPRGTLKYGVLKEHLVGEPDNFDDDRYIVEIKPQNDATVDWAASGEQLEFRVTKKDEGSADFQSCRHLLINFDSEVGIKATDRQTLVVTLTAPTPFFPELCTFYTLFPVNRECVETYGSPRWTKPENLVTNGPFRLQLRRIRDRVRLVKNESYWNAEQVKLDVVDALVVKANTTALSMFLKGEVDWATEVPTSMVPELKKLSEFRTAPKLSTYFYRINVTRPPFDNPLVRRAMNCAIDKKLICEFVSKAGERPSRSLVPPGLSGYEPAMGDDYDPELAKKLLAEAGFPGGRGIPKIELNYNTNDNHRAIAEVIGRQWQETLGINIELKNLEWGVFLDRQQQMDYSLSKAGWIGDYPDPNTFVDMWVTDGTQNMTGWSNARYDELVRLAAEEKDTEKRMALLFEAETILMQEVPIIPIYYYVSKNLVSKRVKGYFDNILDDHPLTLMDVERR